MFNKVCVIGLGYIGLPTAAILARGGYDVVGVDVNPEVVETINSGHVHIVEPDLLQLVRGTLTSGDFRAALEPESADVFLIAVPTPVHEGRKPDLSYVRAAAEAVAPMLERGNLVLLESTSPLGTTRKLEEWLINCRPDLTFPKNSGDEADIQLAYCPERVLPGKIIDELVENDRIIGGLTSRGALMGKTFYAKVVNGECITTTAETAEMCKLVENSSRDVQIAFANELSIICDKFNIDVWELISLANRHPRVNILRPGPGVGGHCIAVDPWFIVDSAPEEARLIRMAREVNDFKPVWVIEKIKIAIAETLSLNPSYSIGDVRVSCFGIAFKPDIDDLRESPSLSIVEELVDLGVSIMVVEPNVTILPGSLRATNAELVSIQDAIKNADIVCILVNHSEFFNISSLYRDNQAIIDVVGL